MGGVAEEARGEDGTGWAAGEEEIGVGGRRWGGRVIST